MRPMTARALALVGAIALSACVGPPPPATPAADGPAPLEGLVLGDCTGFSAAGPLMPSPVSPGGPPPGWDPKPGLAAAGLLGFDCRRVALGPYERGPVRLLAEVHDDFEAPGACDADGSHFDGRVLASLLVDDDAIARELAQAHGMPVRQGAIAAPAVGPDGLVHWTWTEPGRPASTLSFAPGVGPAGDGRPLRLFWPAAGGIGRLDLEMERYASTLATAGAGDLHGSLLDGPFAGSVQAHGPYTAAGVFQWFAGAGCGGAPA